MHSQCALLESRRTAEAQQKVDEEASTRALREAQAKITELTEQARASAVPPSAVPCPLVIRSHALGPLPVPRTAPSHQPVWLARAHQPAFEGSLVPDGAARLNCKAATLKPIDCRGSH